ncbi:hypothetical protein RDI58_004231 [Solanum bulbocastanum]|uniref:Uncharacterized protein n=1 Tax=Solanum bulbocastanum TaxID=147425 RepID=A0AAN8TYH4_SOLBU
MDLQFWQPAFPVK